MLIIASYDENGVPDAMNAAWGGISESNEISMCLSEGHKTVKNILSRKAFTVSMADAAHVVECDYVGMESGNQVANKMEKAGFTVFDHYRKQDVPMVFLTDNITVAKGYSGTYDTFDSYYIEKVRNAKTVGELNKLVDGYDFWEEDGKIC